MWETREEQGRAPLPTALGYCSANTIHSTPSLISVM